MKYKYLLTSLKKYPIEILIVVFALCFSYWLMFHTFAYSTNAMLISTRVWSDFASHIPLIRSFSLGDNFPPEYPMFPGEPIRYHFLFYFLVGILEKIGVRIDLALNILSASSFALLLILIYFLAKDTFKNKTVGVLSVFLFLCNSSLSFLEFFKSHPLSVNIIHDVLKNTSFSSFGPWDGKIVSAFWNLNIYTNQRHLALSFAIPLLIIYLLFIRWEHETKWIKKSLLISILAGILLFINQATFAITLVWIAWFIVLRVKKRYGLLSGIFYGIPFVLLFIKFVHTTSFIVFKPAYLISEPLTVISFLTYWFHNLGITIILFPLALLIAKKQRLTHLIPLIILFTIPNIYQLSPDIINNHKFFNFFLLIILFYVANLLVFLWNHKKQILFSGKIFAIVLFFFLTLSGIIDLMVIKNDTKLTLTDYQFNADASFFATKTAKDAIILNSTFLYHPASLAGRKIFYGYSYFAWSYGYNTTTREQIYVKMYQANDKQDICKLLKNNNISYIELNKTPEAFINPNVDFFESNFSKIYSNPQSGISVFDVKTSCSKI